MRRLAAIALVTALAGFASPAFAKEEQRFLELQPQAGFSYINLTGFSQGKFRSEAIEDAEISAETGTIPVHGTGPSFGAGVQLVAWVFVVGARYNYSLTSDFDLHTVAADLGLRIGDEVALYGRAGLGLAFMSRLPQDLTTSGYVVPASGGLDFKLNRDLSLGFGLDVEVLLLTQARKIGDAVSGDLALQEIDRDTAGFHLRPQLHLTWHAL